MSIYRDRETAISKGSKLYFRDKPCAKCGEIIFRININSYDICHTCFTRRKTTNKNQVLRSVNYLSKID